MRAARELVPHGGIEGLQHCGQVMPEADVQRSNIEYAARFFAEHSQRGSQQGAAQPDRRPSQSVSEAAVRLESPQEGNRPSLETTQWELGFQTSLPSAG